MRVVISLVSESNAHLGIKDRGEMEGVWNEECMCVCVKEG